MNVEEESDESLASYPRLTMSELAALYKRDKKTVLGYLKPIEKDLGPRIGHTYSRLQVKKIFKYLGAPLLAYLMNSYEALAGRREHYAGLRYAYDNNHHSNISHPTVAVESIAIPFVIYLIVQSFVMTTWVIINCDRVLRSFRYNRDTPKASEAVMMDSLRITCYIIYGFIVCGAIGMAGYLFGNMLFS